MHFQIQEIFSGCCYNFIHVSLDFLHIPRNALQSFVLSLLCVIQILRQRFRIQFNGRKRCFDIMGQRKNQFLPLLLKCKLFLLCFLQLFAKHVHSPQETSKQLAFFFFYRHGQIPFRQPIR